MKYLLDTNVLSEARRKQPDTGVLRWLNGTLETDLYLSVLVLGEIRKGVAKLMDAPRLAVLLAWLEGELVPRFAERLLGVDTDTAFIWGRLSGEGERRASRRRWSMPCWQPRLCSITSSW